MYVVVEAADGYGEDMPGHYQFVDDEGNLVSEPIAMSESQAWRIQDVLEGKKES